jgi:hypothetical protein
MQTVGFCLALQIPAIPWFLVVWRRSGAPRAALLDRRARSARGSA